MHLVLECVSDGHRFVLFVRETSVVNAMLSAMARRPKVQEGKKGGRRNQIAPFCSRPPYRELQ